MIFKWDDTVKWDGMHCMRHGAHALHAPRGGPRAEGMQRGPGSVRDAESRVVGGLVGGEVPKAAGANGERVKFKVEGG